MSKRRHPVISLHETLAGKLEVDWGKNYNKDFSCPHCQTGKLTGLYFRKSSICQFGLGCNTCGKVTHLAQNIPGIGKRNSPISIHQTLNLST